MKITQVEPILVGAPTPGCGLLSNRNYFYILVHTDEGITGLGEATLESHDDSLLGVLKDLSDLVVGRDPMDVGLLVQHLFKERFWKGGVVKASIISGIELACWDIKGKALGKPVYELFGGKIRDKIRVYANGWTGGATDPAVIKDKAAEAIAAGYKAFKFSLAIPTWPMRDLETVKRIRKAAETIRDAVGPDAPFKQEFRRLLQSRAVSVVQPDLAHCHGFLEGVKIAAISESFNGFVAPHCPMSPVITAISLHLDAIAPNFLIQERLFLNDWRNDVITQPLVVKDGFLELNDKPGWGVELDMDLCRKHPRIVAGTPSLHRQDGALADW